MTQLIAETCGVCTLAELVRTLKHLSENALHTINDNDVALVGAPLTIRVECETLSDRSEVWNLIIKEDRPNVHAVAEAIANSSAGWCCDAKEGHTPQCRYSDPNAFKTAVPQSPESDMEREIRG